MIAALVITAALAATVIAYSAYDRLFLPLRTAKAVVVWKRYTPAYMDAAATYGHHVYTQMYDEWIDVPESWRAGVKAFNEVHVLRVERSTYALLHEGGEADLIYGLGRLSGRVFPCGLKPVAGPNDGQGRPRRKV